MVQQNIRNSKYKNYNKCEKMYMDETMLLKKLSYVLNLTLSCPSF